MLVDKKYVSVKFSETKLKKRHKALAVLYDIGSDLTSSLSLTEVLDRAIVKVREHFKMDAVRIYLLDETEQYLDLVAYNGLAEAQVHDLRKVPITKGFSGKAFRTRSFIAQKVSDLKNGQRKILLHHAGLEVVICVPLIVKDHVVGVMNLGSKRMVSLNQEKIDLLVAIGNQIAIAANVARLYEDVLEKAEEIREKKEDLEFFAYTISHDLKNPAIGVSGFAKLLARKYEHALDEKGKEYCQHIKQSAERIERFTKEINDYIKAKKVSLNIGNTNVKKIIRQVRDELSPELNKRKIALSAPHSIPGVFADELAITRVFRNLVDNALKHGGQGLTKITIDYDHNERYHIFSFNNDGVAMKRKGSHVIFEMFRKHPTSNKTEGTGLGLAIVKEIVESHDGQVWFDSDPKKGTTFYVSISKLLGT